MRRYCSQCKKELPICEFYQDRNRLIDTEASVLTACVQEEERINAHYVTRVSALSNCQTPSPCPWYITDVKASYFKESIVPL
jgi:hypothetical protein